MKRIGLLLGLVMATASGCRATHLGSDYGKTSNLAMQRQIDKVGAQPAGLDPTSAQRVQQKMVEEPKDVKTGATP